MASDQMTEGFGDSLWSWIFFKKYNPLGSVQSIAFCYGLFALILAFLSIITAVIYFPLQQYDIPYANQNGCFNNTNNITQQHNSISNRCEVTFQILQQITPPVQFLYYVQNAYVNHRNYVNSYSKQQLQGQPIDIKTAQSQCKPFVFNHDLGKTVSWSGKPLDPNAIASPCGFKAFLFFNDTFKLKKIESGKVIDVKIDQSEITKQQGIGVNYKSRNADEEWINPQDEHFMNWMQNQALMTKQKLWGRIKQPLTVGKYSLLVQNRYRIKTMRIKKGVRILQASSLGGKSFVLPISFGVCSLACLIYGIVFYNKFKSLDIKLQDD